MRWPPSSLILQNRGWIVRNTPWNANKGNQASTVLFSVCSFQRNTREKKWREEIKMGLDGLCRTDSLLAVGSRLCRVGQERS